MEANFLVLCESEVIDGLWHPHLTLPSLYHRVYVSLPTCLKKRNGAEKAILVRLPRPRKGSSGGLLGGKTIMASPDPKTQHSVNTGKRKLLAA